MTFVDLTWNRKFIKILSLPFIIDHSIVNYVLRKLYTQIEITNVNPQNVPITVVETIVFVDLFFPRGVRRCGAF